MLTLTKGDWVRGLAMAILSPVAVAIFAVLGAVVNAPGFDVFLVDWLALGRSLINILIVTSYGAGSGYILKNLLTDHNDNLLGIKGI